MKRKQSGNINFNVKHFLLIIYDRNQDKCNIKDTKCHININLNDSNTDKRNTICI